MEALAATGAAALVTAMVTDGWDSAKAGFARLFGRGDVGRSTTAADRLEQSRGMLAALSGAKLEQARAMQQAAWATRLADLLEENPDVAVELETLMNQMNSVPWTGRMQQAVTNTGNAQQAVQGWGIQVNSFGGH